MDGLQIEAALEEALDERHALFDIGKHVEAGIIGFLEALDEALTVGSVLAALVGTRT